MSLLNLNNFFNLITGKGRETKSLKDTDVIAIGRPNLNSATGYTPVGIRFSDLKKEFGGSNGGGSNDPVCDISMEQQTIILGEILYFTKTDYGSEIDYINPGFTEITRGDNQGIFNIAVEGGYQFGVSPANTGWNTDGWSNLLDIETRSYQDWGNAVGYNPPAMVGQELVMVDYSTNQYYLIKFTQWTQGNAGGGFSYTRQEAVLSEKCAITFSDGSKMNSSRKLVEGTPVTEVVNPDGTTVYQIAESDIYYSLVFFVDAYQGDNFTAQQGNFNKPYQTITSALAAANATGPTASFRALVYVRRGGYSASMSMYNYVDVYCEPNVEFNFGQITVGSVNANFLGKARFNTSGSVNASRFLLVTGVTDFNFEFDTATATGATIEVGTASGGNVNIRGRYIKGGISTNITMTLRGAANVTMNIDEEISGYHEVINVRYASGNIVINCPRIKVLTGNLYGGFLKAALKFYENYGVTMTVNGNLISDDPTYYGGSSGIISTWVSPNINLTLNGNIYAKGYLGLYHSSTSGGVIRINGNITSNTQPVYTNAGVTYIKGDIGYPVGGLYVPVRMTGASTLFIKDAMFKNDVVDGNMIEIGSASANLYVYNSLSESAGAAGSFIYSSVGAVNVNLHNVRSKKALGAGVTDLLSPTGLIVDPNTKTLLFN